MFCTILSGDCRRTHSADRLFGPEEGELCPRGSFAGSVLYLNVIGARNLAAFVLESIVSALGSFSLELWPGQRQEEIRRARVGVLMLSFAPWAWGAWRSLPWL